MNYSQETLVDPTLLAHQYQDDLTVLEFSSDNMTNTKISVRGKRYLSYVVESNRDNTRTSVYRVEYQSERTLVATIDRGNVFPDKITLDGATIRLSQWLRTPTLSEFPAKMHVGGVDYVWKKNLVDQLRMVARDEPATPLAWFCRSRYQTVDKHDVYHPATLFITKDADEVRESVLVACVILEHKIRLRAKAYGVTMVADAMRRPSHSY
ncbi:hypothetical protein EUX98_g5163 [Antrodiella citrinella]|uniref:DUF6593 domain-containing protein n=1 Tax=Antrodiella citrinella TaxID=2447956 RepID=A0A4S4MS62_9APHY|nr:hypothetical protein EUX98_g5163 [Antrodiella citrinella]